MNDRAKITAGLAVASAFAAALGRSRDSEKAVAADDPTKEKCYGAAKAGENDCAAGSRAAAGTSKIDYQGDVLRWFPRAPAPRWSFPMDGKEAWTRSSRDLPPA